ncbi:MAG TPA: metallophosphoesterase [Candidatus Binatia bacterium]|nr:metallophosphoesterase [Candidatus Binatia bacterium]
MDHFKPFLQIVHVSDLHVGDPTSLPMGTVRDWIRKLKRRVSTGLADLISDGTAPHDPLAVSLFKNFLEEIVEDPEWKDCTTWLVDTGDLTSLGDQPSLNLGIQHLNEFKTVCPKIASIYGNHDGWPGKLPAFSALVDVQAQPSKIMALGYSVTTPQIALRQLIPHGAGEIQLSRPIVLSSTFGKILWLGARSSTLNSWRSRISWTRTIPPIAATFVSWSCIILCIIRRHGPAFRCR